MDFGGVELILIGAKEDIVEELGEVAKDLEETAEEEEEESSCHTNDHRCNLAEEQVFHNMRIQRKWRFAIIRCTGYVNN